MPVLAGWPSTIDDGSKITLPNLNRATVAGISVAIVGNILISLALNCQKLAHHRLEHDRENKQEPVSQDPGSQNGLKVTTIGASVNEEEEESGEVTPTGEHPFGGHLRRTTSGNTVLSPVSGVAILETEHLLGDGERVPSYGTHAPANSGTYGKQATALLSRLSPWRKRAKRVASSPDHAHGGASHSLIPIDVVEVRQTPDNGCSDAGTGAKDDVSESDYLKSKLWWLGFLLMNIGELGNFISYAFAPASVVAPLGTFALVANCVFAPLMLGERFHKRDFLGIMIAIIGAITVVLSANPSDSRLDPDGLILAISQPVFLVYSIVYIVGAIVLSGLSEGSIGTRYVFVDVGLCALFGGFTVLSTKAISTLLTMEWFEIFTEWITYPVILVLLGTGVGQIRYLNRALMRFDSKIVVPTQFITFNLSAIVGSAILYGDFRRATFHQIITFLYGCAATFAGVFIIAWAPGSSEGEGDEIEQSGDDVEIAREGRDENAISRNPRMDTRRNRAALVIPDGAIHSPGSSPILRTRRSMNNMMGLSPAQYSQRLLLVHTPPHDSFARPLSHDYDRSPAHSYQRRRTISWVAADEGQGRRNGRTITSVATSRDASRSRTTSSDTSGRSPQ